MTIKNQLILKNHQMSLLASCMGSTLWWTCHRTLCVYLHRHQPGDPIPPIPPESDSYPPPPPLEVLEHTQVEKNVFRWVVYVVWLTDHPHACHWYRKIEKERPHLVPSMFTLLFWCGVAWLRGKRRISLK